MAQEKVYDLVTINKSQYLSMVGELPFSEKQINLLMQKTPSKFIKSRPIPGGGEAEFVETHYVIGMLNLITGYQWDFDIVDEKEKHGQIIIQGKLSITTKKGGTISKSQYGRAPIKFKTKLEGGKKIKTDETVDYGNDHKAAASDAIKKCASLFGVAWDVYGKEDMREMQIIDTVVQEQNQAEAEAEILSTPIEEVKARVQKKLDTLSSVERMRALKGTGHTSINKLTQANWRYLDSELGTDKVVKKDVGKTKKAKAKPKAKSSAKVQ